MIVYHVYGATKLSRYAKCGHIKPPVRAWDNIGAAERFSKQTGKPIIPRLKFPDDAPTLEGHRGQARFIETAYDVSGMLGRALA
jgi:hypothetical protein